MFTATKSNTSLADLHNHSSLSSSVLPLWTQTEDTVSQCSDLCLVAAYTRYHLDSCLLADDWRMWLNCIFKSNQTIKKTFSAQNDLHTHLHTPYVYGRISVCLSLCVFLRYNNMSYKVASASLCGVIGPDSQTVSTHKSVLKQCVWTFDAHIWDSLICSYPNLFVLCKQIHLNFSEANNTHTY